jgi:dihydrofolate reductase
MTGNESESERANRSELETDLELAAIVAVAENGIIGRDGEMPWHLPEDLAHFRRTTIVLTSRDLETPENAVVARSLEEALRRAETAADERHDGTDTAFIAGGATVYEQFLPAVDRLIVTEIHDDPDGDTHFPDWNREEWTEIARDERDGFAFVEYGREFD